MEGRYAVGRHSSHTELATWSPWYLPTSSSTVLARCCITNSGNETLWNWLICLVTEWLLAGGKRHFHTQKVWSSLDSFPNSINTLCYERSNWGEPALWIQIWDLSMGRQKRAKTHQSVSTRVIQTRLSQLWKTQFSCDSSNSVIVPTSPLYISLTCPTGHVFPESAQVPSQRYFSSTSISPLTSSNILYLLLHIPPLNCIWKEGRKEIGRKEEHTCDTENFSKKNISNEDVKDQLKVKHYILGENIFQSDHSVLIFFYRISM